MRTFATTYFSLFMGLAVLLCGAHARDVTSLTLQPIQILGKKVFGDDPSLIKTAPDLHNHVDKQTLNALGDNNPMQADNRSLQRKHAHHQGQISRRGVHWLSDLWHLATA